MTTVDDVTLTEVEGKVLRFLAKVADTPMKSANACVVGLNVWAVGKKDVKWSAYALVATRMLKSLERKGLAIAYYIPVKGSAPIWKITKEGTAKVATLAAP